MGIHLLFIYFLASILLFFILDYIDKKDQDNYINHILISVIYIIFLAGIFATFGIDNNNGNIFLIVLFEFLIKIFYTNYVLEKNFFKNNSFVLKIYLITIIVCYLVNYTFIKRVLNVFPGIKELKIIIWLLILIYAYIVLKKYVTLKEVKNDNTLFYNDKDYVVMQYAKFKNKYFNIVNTKYKELYPVIYAIMIRENYYKPEFIRKLDKLKYKLDNEERKFGIMQVISKNIIDDEGSIDIAIKSLEKIYLKLNKNNKKNKDDLIGDILKKYYDNDIAFDEVIKIYKLILEFDNKR